MCMFHYISNFVRRLTGDVGLMTGDVGLMFSQYSEKVDRSPVVCMMQVNVRFFEFSQGIPTLFVFRR